MVSIKIACRSDARDTTVELLQGEIEKLANCVTDLQARESFVGVFIPLSASSETCLFDVQDYFRSAS